MNATTSTSTSTSTSISAYVSAIAANVARPTQPRPYLRHDAVILLLVIILDHRDLTSLGNVFLALLFAYGEVLLLSLVAALLDRRARLVRLLVRVDRAHCSPEIRKDADLVFLIDECISGDL